MQHCRLLSHHVDEVIIVDAAPIRIPPVAKVIGIITTNDDCSARRAETPNRRSIASSMSVSTVRDITVSFF